MAWQRNGRHCGFCLGTLGVVREWYLRLTSLGIGTPERAEARRAWSEAADVAEAERIKSGHSCLVFQGFTKAEGA